MIATVQTKPRPVFCVIEDEHRNRALADAITAGRFTHAGVTLELGTRPDWLRAPFPPDEEWRIEFSKFYYGLDLATAFRETGDVVFLRSWQELVESWIEQVPMDFDSTDVTARRIQNWIYAWNIFESAGSFVELHQEFTERLIASIQNQALYVRENLSAERNHRTLELYALFIVALALPDIENGEEMLPFVIAELHRNLLTDIRADGVHREQSTHYHMIALRSFVAARMNAERYGLTFPKEYDERLERACEFAMHIHKPDGSIPALSDADTGSYRDVLELAAVLFARPDFLWGATAGREGVPPELKYASFDHGGYFIQRSGWGNSATDFAAQRFLIFDCGPVGDGGHGHYDALSIEIAADGLPLVVDPGRYTYFEGDLNWRKWFKSTSAHNTVCVDGLDQTPYRCGKTKGSVATTVLIERLSAPNFDLLCGQTKSPCYDTIHTRFVFLVADEYWVIVDQLRGGRRHNYDLRFHLSPEAMNHTSVRSCDGNFAVLAPGVALVSTSPYKPTLEPGWFAPKYGVKLGAPVVSIRSDGTAEADFFTLIAPHKLNDPPPSLKVIESVGRLGFAVSGVGRERSAIDHVTWSVTAEPFEFGFVRGSARVIWRRASMQATSLAFRGCDVEQFTSAEFAADARHRWLMVDEKGHLRFENGGEL